MRSKAEILASFLPTLGIDTAKRGLPAQPQADVFECGLLFADITGFTPLTERLAKTRGAEGAEELARTLNRVFGELTELVLRFGGDTLKFAGDALLAIWPTRGQPLSLQVERTVQCATAIQHAFPEQPVMPGLELSLKLCIGAGEVLVAPLGGMLDRFELLVVGDPLRQVALANEHAVKSSILVSNEARAALCEGAARTRAVSGGWQLEPTPRIDAPVELPETAVPQEDETARLLRKLVPGAIRERIDAGLSEWIAEHRRVTILFIRLPDLTEQLEIERAQSMVQIVQEGLYRYEGSLNKLNADDKGVAVLAALGLPPFFHANDAARGIRAAIDIERELTRQGFRCSIGVTTGLVFCGAIGGSHRREYTIMGDVVNLAARLMMAAPSGVLCDRATRDHAGERQAFEALEPIRVKGKSEAVEVFRPNVAHAATQVPESRRAAPLFGRNPERAQLGHSLERLLDPPGDPSAKPLRPVLVSGRAGMGKSALMESFARDAEQRGIGVLVARGDILDRGVPYHAWRGIALRLFELSANAEIEARRSQIEAVLESLGEPSHLAPLLAALLPLGEWTSPRIDGLEARDRAAQTRALFCRVLSARTAEHPQLVILEDAHALDSASWALVREVLVSVCRLRVVLTARSDEVSGVEELAALEADCSPELVYLGELSDEAILEIVRHQLHVEEIPDDIARAIIDRSEGNPRFAEELILALRDSGVLVQSENRYRLRAGARLTQDVLPPTLQAALTRRIDQLGAAEQLTLKVASVMGAEFELAPLQEIYPVDIQTDVLRRHIEVLSDRSLAEPVANAVAEACELENATSGHRSCYRTSYRFRSHIARQVAYDLMLFSQRRSLHRRLAEWYETAVPDLVPLYGVLAHHWRTAADGPQRTEADVTRALGYLERAASQAAYNYANHDAIRLYREALELLSWLPEAPEIRGRELNLRLGLGPVLVSATSWAATDVGANYQRALELADALALPDSRFQALRGLWQYETGRGEYRKAEVLGEQLVGVARSMEDSKLLLEAERMVGNNAFWLGNLAQACVHLEAAVTRADTDSDASEAARYGQDPEVANRGILAWALCLRGERELGLEEARRAFERAEHLEHPFSLAFALGANMWAHVFLEEPAEARSWAERALELTRQHGFAYLETAAQVVHGWARTRLNETSGPEEVERAVREWRASGSSIGMAIFLIYLADAQLAAGHTEAAAAIFEDPLLAELRTSEGWLEPLVRCLRARVLTALGDAEAAEAIASAVELARERGAHLIETRANSILAPASSHAD